MERLYKELDIVVAELRCRGVSIRADHGDVLDDTGIKWQDVVVVLQEHNSLAGSFESKQLMRRCVDIIGTKRVIRAWRVKHTKAKLAVRE